LCGWLLWLPSAHHHSAYSSHISSGENKHTGALNEIEAEGAGCL
jgi:hypothetical protein